MGNQLAECGKWEILTKKALVSELVSARLFAAAARLSESEQSRRKIVSSEKESSSATTRFCGCERNVSVFRNVYE